MERVRQALRAPDVMQQPGVGHPHFCGHPRDLQRRRSLPHQQTLCGVEDLGASPCGGAATSSHENSIPTILSVILLPRYLHFCR